MTLLRRLFGFDRPRMLPPSSILPMGRGSLLARCAGIWIKDDCR